MKILHIITSLKIGGAESALFNLLSKFQEQNLDQHFVAYFYDGPNVKKIKNLGIPVFKISGFIFKYDPLTYFRLKKLVQKIKPDILHCALWTANIFGRLIGKSLNIPVICDLHSNFSHDGSLRIFIEKFFVKKNATYIAVSNSAKDGFLNSVVKKIHNQKQQEKIQKNTFLIRNGIDFGQVKQKASLNKITREEIGLKSTDFVVGSVGRLDPIKSQDVLIKGFALFCQNLTIVPLDTNCKANHSEQTGTDKLFEEVPSQIRTPKLCLIGDGPARNSLETLVKNLSIENKVIFLGQKDDACNFYPLFDCFALSSKSEGLSIALLEALCFGLPIITTHNSTKHDVIIDGENGFLIPVGNTEKISEAIKKLYKNYDLIKKIKALNLELVKAQFEINNTTQEYQKLYLQLRKNFVA